MLCEKIVEMRNILNNMLAEDYSFDEIYAISIELDKLIVEYYRRMQ